jgi:hypothetical protein
MIKKGLGGLMNIYCVPKIAASIFPTLLRKIDIPAVQGCAKLTPRRYKGAQNWHPGDARVHKIDILGVQGCTKPTLVAPLSAKVLERFPLYT